MILHNIEPTSELIRDKIEHCLWSRLNFLTFKVEPKTFLRLQLAFSLLYTVYSKSLFHYMYWDSSWPYRLLFLTRKAIKAFFFTFPYFPFTFGMFKSIFFLNEFVQKGFTYFIVIIRDQNKYQHNFYMVHFYAGYILFLKKCIYK